MIKNLIARWAPKLNVPSDIDAPSLLWAVYFSEKYNKKNRVPRFEPAYAPGGYYYDHSSEVRREYEMWEESACCSYSNFQILYIVARELGYQGPPLGLDRDSVAIEFVVKYINQRIFGRGAKTVEQVADGYNSGSFKDGYQPVKYIQKFLKHYQDAYEKL